MPEQALAGRRVVVFGAGTTGDGVGIGQAAAIAYARAGANVVSVDRDPAALARAVAAIGREGGGTDSHLCDITNAAHLAEIVAAIEKDGPIDIAHNNVGIFRQGDILEGSPEDFRLVMEVNLGGAYNVARTVLPAMLKRRRGIITNISSYVSQGYLPGKFAYQVSKAALESLTMGIALDFAARGIRCNAILPGVVDTPLARGGLRQFYDSDEAMLAALDAASPTGKSGTPWDIANAAVFLASDAASYINGVSLLVDGGAIWRMQ